MHMRKFMPVVGLLVLAGVVTTLVGCVEAEFSYQVYPDGSGKVCISGKMTMPVPPEMVKEQLESMKKKLYQESPFNNYSGIYINPDAMKVEMVEGKVHQYIELVFEDINKVTDADGRALGSLTVLENGDFKLTLNPPSKMDKLDMLGEGPGADPQMEEMMKNVLKGLKVVTILKMPGEIKTSPLPNKEGCTTSLTMTDEDIFNKEKRAATAAIMKALEVTCGPMADEKMKAEHEAFKKDLPKIIEASKKFMEELKKEEAEDEGEDEGEGKEEGDEEEKKGT